MNTVPAQNISPLRSWAKPLWLVVATIAIATTINVIVICVVYWKVIFAWAVYGSIFASKLSIADDYLLVLPIFILFLILLLPLAIGFSVLEKIEKSELAQAILRSFFEVLTRLLTPNKIKQGLQVAIWACLALPVAYEVAYFHALDISIIAIPVSLLDRFYGSTIWILHTLASLIISYVILPIMMLSLEETLISRSAGKVSTASTALLTALYLATLGICIYLSLWIFDISIVKFTSYMQDDILLIFFCFAFVAFYTSYRMYGLKGIYRRAEKWNSINRDKRTIQLVYAHTIWFILLVIFQWNIVSLYAENLKVCVDGTYIINFTNKTSKEVCLIRSFRSHFLIRDCKCFDHTCSACKGTNPEFLNSNVVHSIMKK